MTLRIVADGEPWVGMLDMNIRRSMDGAYHDFSFETTDRYEDGVGRWNVRGGAEIQIYWESNNSRHNGRGFELLFDGYVNQYNVSMEGSSRRISVAGESWAADLVNYGHEGPYWWRDETAENIITDVLKPYGTQFDIMRLLRPIDANGFRVAVDDSAFNIVQKLAENNGLTVFTGNDGRLKITDGTDAPTMAALTTGDYTQFRASHVLNRAPSRLRVNSQKNVKIKSPYISTTGRGKKVTKTTKYREFIGTQRNQKILTNPNQPRYRPLVIIHNGEPPDVDDFAQYAQQRFAGDSVSAGINVKDIYDPEGKLWGINQLVPITEPAGDLTDKLIISDWEFSVSEDAGLNIGLTLREPRTYSSGVEVNTELRRSLRRQGGVFGELFRGVFGV